MGWFDLVFYLPESEVKNWRKKEGEHRHVRKYYDNKNICSDIGVDAEEIHLTFKARKQTIERDKITR